MSRVLVLRDKASGEATTREIARRGHAPLLLPVQEIAATGEPLPAGPFACVAVASRNAAAVLGREAACRGLETLAVGEGTAEALRSAGCPVAHVGAGSAAHLVAPAVRIARERGGRVLLATGRPRTRTLEDGLAAASVPFAVWETYETRPLHPSRAAIEAVLGREPPDAVLLLSTGQAAGFAVLRAEAPDLFAPLPRLLCLSERIAAALPPELRAGALISPLPDLRQLFDLIRGTNFQRHCLAGSAGETRKTG